MFFNSIVVTPQYSFKSYKKIPCLQINDLGHDFFIFDIDKIPGLIFYPAIPPQHILLTMGKVDILDLPGPHARHLKWINRYQDPQSLLELKAP